MQRGPSRKLPVPLVNIIKESFVSVADIESIPLLIP